MEPNERGKCDAQIAVMMPGGRIDITVADDYSILMKGPVTRVAEGTMYPEMLE